MTPQFISERQYTGEQADFERVVIEKGRQKGTYFVSREQAQTLVHCQINGIPYQLTYAYKILEDTKTPENGVKAELIRGRRKSVINSVEAAVATAHSDSIALGSIAGFL